MNPSSSECSSGCDSGWTLYFQPSSSSSSDGVERIQDDVVLPCVDPKKGGFRKKGFEDEEEEDLSMVSDASSGPPVLYDADEASCRLTRGAARNDYKRQKMNKHGQDRDLRSLLDDTASSPAINNNHYVWKAGVEIPDGRRSAYQEHFGFLHSHNITGDHDNQWFGEKNMNMNNWR